MVIQHENVASSSGIVDLGSQNLERPAAQSYAPQELEVQNEKTSSALIGQS